ncbi:cell division protein FtsK [Mycolicibacterium fallax]|uniref:cell division protein FtsK n=1 Tax=Mycolicibacterium fallax TaxID=1793 RepID=UPI0010560BB1|nr:cell division protein FtsK [Mycolicibacterium fallax]BBY99630.1 hypothetical protein MFAL_30970 [Mycolicibacterium fallax]
MGFIGRWLEDPADRRWRYRQDYRDHAADRREARRAADRALDREQRAAAAAVTARQRENQQLIRGYQDQEKSWYSAPRTEYVGGNNAALKPMRVSHHAAPLPLAFLPHPESPDQKAVVFGPGFMRSRNGDLMRDETWREKARETLAVWTDIKKRYLNVLSRLRDETWWRELTIAAGLTHATTTDEPWTGQYASGTRKLTTVSVPRISRVQVAEDGLRLTVELDVNVPPKRWQASVDTLRAGFKAAGMSAGNLRVGETSSGAPLLIFDDAPSAFPAAVCLEPPREIVASAQQASKRYEGACWMLGLDSRGKTVKYPLDDFPHVLVAGGTGAGKSVWARSIIEMFRTGYRDPDTGKDTAGGFTAFISSGKPSDFATLHTAPGVAMVARDAAQTAVMVRTVREEVERRFEAATEAKLNGDGRAFDFPPILLLLDEWGATSITLGAAYKSAAPFESDVDLILRLAREARAHVALLSQTIRKTGAGAVPGSWQANLGLTVSLGQPEAETLNNPGVFNTATRARAEVLGSRIAGKKGRGMVTTGSDLIEFQSVYTWSPGTTSLDPDADRKVRPPTDEVRSLWEQWEPVSAATRALMPRLGIRAEDEFWATGDDGKKPDLDQVAATPTVPLTDRDGDVLPGMERFDPWSPSFVGKRSVSRGGVMEFDTPSAPSSSPDAPTAHTSRDSQGQAEKPRLTPEQVREEAIRLGYLKPDDETPAAAPETPETDKPKRRRMEGFE